MRQRSALLGLTAAITLVFACAVDAPLGVRVATAAPISGEGAYHALVIGAGASSSCAVDTAGIVQCWGANDRAQLGAGVAGPPQLPWTVRGVPSAIDIAVGDGHVCSLGAGGAVTCWGEAERGRLAVPPGMLPAIELSAGRYATCALLVDSTVRCWGDDGTGEVSVPALADVGRLATSGTCAVMRAGTVSCWGPAPRPPAGLNGVSDVATHRADACAVLTDGSVRCWSAGASMSPPGLTDAVQVAVGAGFACARLRSGDVSCWGSPDYGQTTPPENIERTVSIAAGDHHACVTTTTGQAYCWGLNDDRQTAHAALLQNRTTGWPSVVAAVPLDGDVAAIAEGGCQLVQNTVDCPTGLPEPAGLTDVTQLVGGSFFACALHVAGTVTCWNDGFFVRNGVVDPPPGLDDVAQLAADTSAGVCALRHDDNEATAVITTVTCWGIAVPSVPSLVDAVQIAKTHGLVCALRATGDVVCPSGPPPPADLGPAVMIDVDTRPCAITTDAIARCWGTPEPGEPPPPPVTDVVELELGFGQGCLLDVGGTAHCWSGAVGSVGFAVPAGLRATTLSLNSYNGCAIRRAGGTTCWGADPSESAIPEPGPWPGQVTITPARLLETRPAPPAGTIDGRFNSHGIRGAGTVTELPVAGRGGVPLDATAVALTVTATDATGPGYVTVYPCGTARPAASSVNFDVGQTVPNTVTSKLGAGGTVCVFTLTTTHLLIDVNGFVPVRAGVTTIVPARLFESRAGEPTATIDGRSNGGGSLVGGTVTAVQVAGRAGVPLDATAAMINVTATQTTRPGYVTVFPCGSPTPLASNLNHDANQTVASGVIAPVGDRGHVCFFTSATTHLVVDVNGYHTATSLLTASAPRRVMDTRPGVPATIDGLASGTGALAAASITELQIGGRAGVPVTAATAALTVTVTEPQGAGYITVFPCGAPFPTASNLNYRPGQTVANAVATPIGSAGRICIFTLAPTQLVVDLTGFA